MWCQVLRFLREYKRLQTFPKTKRVLICKEKKKLKLTNNSPILSLPVPDNLQPGGYNWSRYLLPYAPKDYKPICPRLKDDNNFCKDTLKN